MSSSEPASASGVLAPTTILAPFLAASLAIARPRPYEPPPITITCPDGVLASARALHLPVGHDRSAGAAMGAGRGGNARRASGRAEDTNLRVAWRSPHRTRSRIRHPPPAHPLAQPATSRGPRGSPAHVRSRGTVPDVLQDQPVRRLSVRAAGDPLAALGLSRSGCRRAQPASG